MAFTIERTPIDDVIVVNPQTFHDERGFFREVYRQDQFSDLGMPDTFVQLNHSGSAKRVIRGLHFQWAPLMGKLMRVTRGQAFLVAVDIRKASPSLGKWVGLEVSEENGIQVWAPAGFARGFCALSDFTEIQYLCTGTYNSKCESGIRWDDPEIGVAWPIGNPILTKKDQSAQTLREWLGTPDSNYFTYAEKVL
jgi:dTDP-4-dehydrorhamnose 3,5-epimerase